MFPRKLTTMPGARWFAITFHLFVVMIPGGLLFREVSVTRVWHHLAQNPFAFTSDELVVAWVVLSITALLASPMVFQVFAEDYILPRLRRSAWYFPIQTATWGAWAVLIFVFHRDTSYDFIYFQF
jgi:hypothetical protein